MNENNQETKKTKLAFEHVDVQQFLGDSQSNDNLPLILTKVAGNNPTVVLGIQSLLTEKLILRSFNRAFTKLITAKSDMVLPTVEAGFQTTVNEVKNYHEQNSPYMTRQKTSLYLYTLQHLIMYSLERWVFPNQAPNNFKPALKEKLQQARAKSKILGINDDVIRRECYLTDFQQPYDPVLRNFEFLDESRLDSYLNRLHHYEVTHNPDDLYDVKTFPTSHSTNQKTKAVETLIHHMEKKFGVKEMTLKYYKQHFNAINQEIMKIIGANDLPTVYEVIDAMTQYLEAKRQFKIQVTDRII